MFEKNKIYQGDSLAVLKTLPDEIINCCVTSPPYYGLRDYGEEGQIGLEETPDKYVERLVDVFREVKRVLRKDGTLWLNLGDSYATGTKAGRQPSTGMLKGHTAQDINRIGTPNGCKTKDLIGIPWLVAFALQADGWYLRQDIIWHKPNPMPESVKDRCTKAHEYIFLLSKSQKYYYDQEAIGSDIQECTVKRYKRGWNGDGERDFPGGPQNHFKEFMDPDNEKRGWANKKSVWQINTHPEPDAHFAVFPQKLIDPCIKAGCPEDGTVLDPFIGSGTTGIVARKQDKNFIGIELNPEYIKIADKRLYKELGMFK